MNEKVDYESIIRWVWDSPEIRYRAEELVKRLIHESRQAGVQEDTIKTVLEEAHKKNRMFSVKDLERFRESVEKMGGTMEEFEKAMDNCENALFNEIVASTLFH